MAPVIRGNGNRDIRKSDLLAGSDIRAVEPEPQCACNRIRRDRQFGNGIGEAPFTGGEIGERSGSDLFAGTVVPADRILPPFARYVGQWLLGSGKHLVGIHLHLHPAPVDAFRY